MKVYYSTDKGLKRDNNEDNLIICENHNYLLCVVADGMGGHNAGEIASKIAVEAINDKFLIEMQKNRINIPKLMRDSVKNANNLILDKSKGKEEYDGMGTTITMVVIDKRKKIAYIGNIGDSRTYLINNEINQITKDHSYVQELICNGGLTEEEAKIHPKRNELTRALGCFDSVEMDIFEMSINNNDIYLLCSDGLTTHVSDEKILEYVKESTEDCIDRLIKLANASGGTDNITIIIIDTLEVK